MDKETAMKHLVDQPSATLPEREFLLPDMLDLTAADPLCHALRERLHDGVLILDGSRTARISTPCLQVLAAAAASAGATGIGFRLRHASPVLSAAISDLGLAAVLPHED
ncbi:STAS domain-containing protein [Dankookia sp. GCM10030260]|uniref:STAS domain-containing protein n=1 Tax=Dankookia sp. GCM10030260 TaxID=3273390 RepID=UPI003610B291